jgi:hypothetical protein
MGRQRPTTDTFRAISTGTLERLDRAAQQHQQALKRFKKELATAVPGALLTAPYVTMSALISNGCTRDSPRSRGRFR